MNREQLCIRDPFILAWEDKYLLTGTVGMPGWKQGIYGFLTEDLETFSDPILLFDPPENFWADRDFWAPEIHQYRGQYYMFVSFRSHFRRRATQVLVAETPTGPYVPISMGPHTPAQWHCLDGTLFVDDQGDPWMVYVREFVQMVDGEMYAQRLSRDLTHLEGEPIKLFSATWAPWCVTLRESGKVQPENGYITDGPFVFRLPEGGLGMLWSSFCKTGYCQAVCYSDNGSITGPWKQMDQPLYKNDSGHGMLFSTIEGKQMLVVHDHNNSENGSHPVFLPVEMTGSRLKLKEG